uniref:Uncharacterized protein n=1 Tax=Cacopsylla melanoneura TaxID=428564 RepID=A0A8D8SGU3_9HEMI
MLEKSEKQRKKSVSYKIDEKQDRRSEMKHEVLKESTARKIRTRNRHRTIKLEREREKEEERVKKEKVEGRKTSRLKKNFMLKTNIWKEVIISYLFILSD